MIRRLRKRHRLMTLTLAPIGLIGLGLALTARVEMPVQAEPGRRPVEALAELPSDPAVVWSEPWIDVTRVDREARAVWIELSRRAPAGPDRLVYWSENGTLDGALLLGELAGAPHGMALPDAAATKDGHLLVYSLAHGEIVASAPFPAVGE